MAEGDWNSKARGIRVFDFSWGSTGKESRGGGNEYGTTWWIGSRNPELKETTPLVHWEFESPKIKRSVPKRASASDRIFKRPNVKLKSLLNKKVRSRLVTPLNSRFPGIYIYLETERRRIISLYSIYPMHKWILEDVEILVNPQWYGIPLSTFVNNNIFEK